MDLKKQVVKQIAEGKTNQQIIDFMVDRYGDFVLYNPAFQDEYASALARTDSFSGSRLRRTVLHDGKTQET